MDRRSILKSAATVPLGLGMGAFVKSQTNNLDRKMELPFKHSVCRWCYGKIPLEEFVDQAKDLGIHSIEIVGINDWDTILDRGLEVGLSSGSDLGIPKGFNDPQYHEQLQSDYAALIPKAAEKGIPQIICFSGNRNGMADDVGLENCAKGLDPIVKLAEQHDVIITMELLNSKVNHPDYMCDHTPWGVQLVEKVGSPNFKLLYDIYHMQIMEGDVIRTLTDNADYISHYHTGGVPGRNEIDETQELNYKAIVKAIIDTGFQGYIAQEFIPKRPFPIASLAQGIQICTV